MSFREAEEYDIRKGDFFRHKKENSKQDRHAVNCDSSFHSCSYIRFSTSYDIEDVEVELAESLRSCIAITAECADCLMRNISVSSVHVMEELWACENFQPVR